MFSRLLSTSNFFRPGARIAALLCIAMLAGCASWLWPESAAPPTDTATPTASVTPVPPLVFETPTAAITPSRQEIPLRLWLPPVFDPEAPNLAGALLRARLDAFAKQHPQVQLEVRLKPLDGPGGMLDALSTASAAAPLALPDLVALPRSLLESAALKGLLHPFDGFTSALDASDWYTYARQLALLENSQFGFPFAGDVLLVVYHPSALPQPPLDWNTTLAISSTLAFPASDPQALFTLALYQSLGGPVRDEQGRPVLDAQTLEQVFDFYARAGEGGQMPYWLAQYETDGQIWDALVQKQAPMAITWASHYLARSGEQSLDLAVSQLPTLEGRPFTLATGWVWALASTRPERQELSAALAEFLVEPLFLSRWTAAAGFFPTRADALPAWSALHPDPAISAILLSASLYPPADVLTVLGPILQQSVVEVLKQQATPPDAARTAIERLNAP